jgi:hypothetical protein
MPRQEFVSGEVFRTGSAGSFGRDDTVGIVLPPTFYEAPTRRGSLKRAAHPLRASALGGALPRRRVGHCADSYREPPLSVRRFCRR